METFKEIADIAYHLGCGIVMIAGGISYLMFLYSMIQTRAVESYVKDKKDNLC